MWATPWTEQPPLAEFAFFIEVHFIEGGVFSEGIFPGKGVEVS